MNNVNKIFAYNLKKYLNKKDVTQKDLAESIGVSTSAVNTWCKGQRVPRMDKIEKMAKYFGVQKSDLLENKHFDAPDLSALMKMLVADKDFYELVTKISNMDSNERKKMLIYIDMLK